MTRITSEALASARSGLAHTRRAARLGVEWCARLAQDAARLPRRLLHR